ncbi:MAG: hypothetical protein KAI47_23790, partial [Deltaproteobacteria bacterium]|nr:hypothetical protein [Deltaproteobacteria bacterium]
MTACRPSLDPDTLLADAETLLARFASPLYVYNPSQARAQLRHLQTAFADLPLQIRYAVKANPCRDILTALREPLDGERSGIASVDVASRGELALAHGVGFSGDTIVFTGPGKGDDELRVAIDAGAHISVESLGEIERLAHLARRARHNTEASVDTASDAASSTPDTASDAPDTASDQPVAVRLRINPREMIHAYGLATGGGPSPFGIDEERLPDAAASLRRHRDVLRFEGIHVHPGSQCFSAAAMARSFKATLALARGLEKRESLASSVINLGGGLGFASWQEGSTLDLADLSARLAALWHDHGKASVTARGGQTTLELEPGRFIAGPAGRYLCRVIDVKVSRDRRFVVIDGGMHHLLAATGIYGPRPPRAPLLDNLTGMAAGRPRQRCTVVGRLCTPLDTLAED